MMNGMGFSPQNSPVAYGDKRGLKHSWPAVIFAIFTLLLLVFVFFSNNAESDDEEDTVKPVLTVELIYPKKESWQSELMADGRITAWQEASVGSQTQGLKVTQLFVDVGDAVKKGDVLAEFERITTISDLAQLDASVRDEKAKYNEAVQNYRRAASLLKQGAISKKDHQEFTTTMLSAKARWESAQAARENGVVRLNQTKLIAPDDGVISYRNTSIGTVSNTGQELFRMIVQNRLEWQAELSSRYLSNVVLGQSVKIILSDGNQISGKIRQISPTIDNIKNTIIVYVDLEESPFIRAGMFVRGYFIGKSNDVLTLPTTAVVMRDGFHYVFRLLNNAEVEMIKVNVLGRKNDKIAITGNIKEDEPFVVSGVDFLKDGDRVTVINSHVKKDNNNERILLGNP